MTPEERAVLIFEKPCYCAELHGAGFVGDCNACTLAAVIREAEEAARAQAFREAAEIVRKRRPDIVPLSSEYRLLAGRIEQYARQLLEEVATAIASASTPQTKQEGK